MSGGVDDIRRRVAIGESHQDRITRAACDRMAQDRPALLFYQRQVIDDLLADLKAQEVMARLSEEDRLILMTLSESGRLYFSGRMVLYDLHRRNVLGIQRVSVVVDHHEISSD